MLCSSISLYKTKVYTYDFCCCSSLCMWFFCLFVCFLKGVYCGALLNTWTSSFQLASIKQIFCRIRGFSLFTFYFPHCWHLIWGCESLWAVHLRVIPEFLRVQVTGRPNLCYLAAPPWWLTWLVSLSLCTPSLSQAESQPKASHQSLREWGSNDDSLIKGLELRYMLVITRLHYLPWGSGRG